MEIIDQHIRHELTALIEADAAALSFVRTKAWQGYWIAFAVISAFICGFAIGSWLFH
jgi:hypothetical protein